MSGYSYKYYKYKTKYNGLKSVGDCQSGAGIHDDVYILYLLDDNLKVAKVNVKKEGVITEKDRVEPGLVKKYQLENIRKYPTDPNPSTITKYIYYDKTIDDSTVKKIIVKENSRIIMEYEPNIYRSFYIYHSVVILIIKIYANKIDETMTSGNGVFHVSDLTIHLQGTCELTKGAQGIRNMTARIKELFIYEDSKLTGNQINNISGIDKNSIISVAKLFELFNKTSTITRENYFKKCSDLLPPSQASKPLRDNYVLTKNIISTVCGRLFYYLGQSNINVLIQYEQLYRFLILNELESIHDNVSKLFAERENPVINSIPKKIPSTLANKYLMIKNGDGRFVNLGGLPEEDEFKVVFDSGNDTVTMIGKTFADALGLRSQNLGCKLKTHGIGGCAVIDCNYVILIFKFSDDYPYKNNKEYSVVAFVNDCESLNDTLLFGHNHGLDLLFDDEYAIQDQYDVTDRKISQLKRSKANLRKNLTRVEGIIDRILAASPRDVDIDFSIAGSDLNKINPVGINSFYYESFDQTKRVFEKLKRAYEKVSKLRGETYPLAVSLKKFVL
ncbi:MAG: hypothetical protein Harvfovirus5_41 [Harvfovirus sp.]|uniref:Uncharacterized protein n=1 Tax=Harvfovirus sp. TaxID=2487768 RepID=A0A3G5A0M4_9VIRU|nr:MAG: hypothetical protein Harvfovirus5_41 [Harvfovirus sp.]